MRRRIQSDSEVKIKRGKSYLPPAHSISQPQGSTDSNLHLLVCEELAECTDCADNSKCSHRVSTECKTLQPVSTPTSPSPEANYLSEVQINSEVLLCNRAVVDSSRPCSLSSVSSSRTSRSSDYFSSSNGNDGQLISHSLGTQIELPTELSETEIAGKGSVLKKLIEPVTEEEEPEEGFVDDDSDVSPLTNTNIDAKVKAQGNDKPSSSIMVGSKHHAEVSVRDINKKLSEIDHLAPVASMAMSADLQLTYVDRVILELLETERMFVRSLEDILAGYLLGIKNASDLPLTAIEVQKLFGNIKDIYAFNRKFLSYLENCESDPVQIAGLFVSKDVSFDAYTKYCTNYPISVAVLTRFMKNPILAEFFKSQQASLGHSLPLGSYLLKPVQRILKYHLILQELVKHCHADIDNYAVIKHALSTMTSIARHINEMKRKHEDAVHIQEIQSLLTNWQGNDLTSYGELVLEDELRLQGAKNERVVFLFDQMMLITKKREDGFLVCKANIMCSDLILLESIKDNPLSFLVTPFDAQAMHPNNHGSRAPKSRYILTTRFAEDKKLWTQQIKRLIIKHHHATIPLRAQESIMNMQLGTKSPDEQKRSRFSNVSLDDAKYRKPFSRFAGAASNSTLSPGWRTKQPLESQTKKSPQTKAGKRKHDVEMGENVRANSVSNQATKSRFSFPRIISVASPKHTSPDVEVAGANPLDSQQKKKSSSENSSSKTKDLKQKEPKYKQSVIYRRHKRRNSQPITDTEMRLSLRLSGDENDDNKSIRDMTMDDFETDELFSFNLDSKRESVSWDVQIVEAVFERFKKESLAQTESTQDIDEPHPMTISLPAYRKNQGTYSSSSESSDDEFFNQQDLDYVTDKYENTAWTPSDKWRLSNSFFEEKSKSESNSVYVSPTHELDSSSLHATRQEKQEEFHPSSNRKLSYSQSQQDKNDMEAPTRTTFSDIYRRSSMPAHTLNCKNDVTIPTVKRSLSTQSSASDRRKYFDRLKEIRERRHSKLLLGIDAKTIHHGLVKEMIEHHRETITSQVRRASLTSPVQKRNSQGCFFSLEVGKMPVHPNDCVQQVDCIKQNPCVNANSNRRHSDVYVRRHNSLNDAKELHTEIYKPISQASSENVKQGSMMLQPSSSDHLSINDMNSSTSRTNSSSSGDEKDFQPTNPIKIAIELSTTKIDLAEEAEYKKCNNAMLEASQQTLIESTQAQSQQDDLILTKSSENKIVSEDIVTRPVTEDSNVKISNQAVVVCQSNQNQVKPKASNNKKPSKDTAFDDNQAKLRAASKSQSNLDPLVSSSHTAIGVSSQTKLRNVTSNVFNKKKDKQISNRTLVSRTANSNKIDNPLMNGRVGRERLRGGKREGLIINNNVMKLANQFDKMSTKTDTTAHHQRRSLSVGAGKHLKDRRLAVTNNWTSLDATSNHPEKHVGVGNNVHNTFNNKLQHSEKDSISTRSAKSKSVERVEATEPAKSVLSKPIPKAFKLTATCTTSPAIMTTAEPKTPPSKCKSTYQEKGLNSRDLLSLAKVDDGLIAKTAFVEKLVDPTSNYSRIEKTDSLTNERLPQSDLVSMFCKVK